MFPLSSVRWLGVHLILSFRARSRPPNQSSAKVGLPWIWCHSMRINDGHLTLINSWGIPIHFEINAEEICLVSFDSPKENLLFSLINRAEEWLFPLADHKGILLVSSHSFELSRRIWSVNNIYFRSFEEICLQCYVVHVLSFDRGAVFYFPGNSNIVFFCHAADCSLVSFLLLFLSKKL